MSHTHTGTTSYKKASPGTMVEVADGNNLQVDGSGTNEVDPDQQSSTTKPVKMITVVCVPGISRNLLSTLKAVE